MLLIYFETPRISDSARLGGGLLCMTHVTLVLVPTPSLIRIVIILYIKFIIFHKILL